MKISTGLRPVAERLRVHRRSNDASLYYVETAEWSAPIVLPLGAAEVWIVTFYKDTEAVRVLVLEKEPKIAKQGSSMVLVEEIILSLGLVRIDERHRDKHNIPDDAVMSKTPSYSEGSLHVTYEWYELTV